MNKKTSVVVGLYFAIAALALMLTACNGGSGQGTGASAGNDTGNDTIGGGGETGDVAAETDPHHSHFRYSHIFWSPAGGNTVEFTVQSAFRRDGFFCRDITTTPISTIACSEADGFAGTGDVIREDIGLTVLDTGDTGNPTEIGSPGGGSLLYEVTSFDAANNWLFGLALDPISLPAVDTTLSHTYSSATDFTANIDTNARIGASDAATNDHINNPDGFYRIETIVNAGSSNSSPVSVLPPIIFCPNNGLCTFTVPGADADGDTLNFRLSTSAEASATSTFVQPGLPDAPNAASINSGTGDYTWDTNGATLTSNAGANTLYSSQVTIEDPTSKVAVDFLIQLVDDIGVDPEFSSPVCNTTVPANVGGTVSFTIEADDPDTNQVVTLNVSGLPSGATMTPGLPITSLIDQPVSSAFSWAPTPADAGVHVVVFDATDNFNQQAFCPVTIDVAESIEGDIDIKPGSDPNSINRNSRGVIPVAILGSAGFDVSTVDVTTLAFGPGGATPAHTAGGHVEDVNRDGFDDLVSHYPTQDIGLPDLATEACVTALLLDSTPFEGCDSVSIVK